MSIGELTLSVLFIVIAVVVITCTMVQDHENKRGVLGHSVAGNAEKTTKKVMTQTAILNRTIVIASALGVVLLLLVLMI